MPRDRLDAVVLNPGSESDDCGAIRVAGHYAGWAALRLTLGHEDPDQPSAATTLLDTDAARRLATVLRVFADALDAEQARLAFYGEDAD